MIMERTVHPGTPILVVYDGSEQSQKALKTAGRICQAESQLTILIPAPSQEIAERLYQQIETWVSDQEFQVQFRWVPDMDERRIGSIAKSQGCEIVILPADSPQLHPEAISRMLEKADCAVLFVR
jgi:hypothetical protein